MRFRIHSVLWIFALVAAAMASFGVGLGIMAAVCILAAKAFIYEFRYGGAVLLFLAAAAVVISLLLTPAVNRRPPSPRGICVNNISNLAKALLYYKSNGGVLSSKIGPPPHHSWRVAILPHLDQDGLYAAYDFDAAWDAPTNRAVANAPVRVFKCPTSRTDGGGTPQTNFSAVTGPDTYWGQDAGGNKRGVSDRLEDTILLIEAPGSHIAWSEPVDFDFEEAVAYLAGESRPAGSEGRSNKKRVLATTGRRDYAEICVAFADGAVRILSLPLRREVAVALLTANGGEQVDSEELYRSPPTSHQYHLFLPIAMLAMLSLIPLRFLVQLPVRPIVDA